MKKLKKKQNKKIVEFKKTFRINFGKCKILREMNRFWNKLNEIWGKK